MEHKSSTNYFKELWDRYPSPINAIHPERGANCYCVAGSLLLDNGKYLIESDAFLGRSISLAFPGEEDFAHALTFIFDLPNSDLVRDKINEIARITIAYNDEERFGEAKSYLARNLAQFELQNG